MKNVIKGSRKYWHKQWVDLSIMNVQLSRALDMACVELTNGAPDDKVIEFLRKALDDTVYIEYKHYLLTGERLTPPTEPTK